MAIRILHDKDKKKRKWAVVQAIIGVLMLAIAVGLYVTEEKYAIPTFALLTALYMLINARVQFL